MASWTDLLGPAAGLGASIIGKASSSSDEAAVDAARQAALDQILKAQVPQSSVNFQQYGRVGTYNPAAINTFKQDPSQMAGVNADPAYKNAQVAALSGLQDVANRGGLTIADQANLNKVLSQTAQQAAGQRGAIAQNFAQRGMNGSGFELAAQLANQQNAANQANQQATDVAGMAQARALQALNAAGSQATQMGAQDFAQQSAKAQAQDLINRFNTQNAQNVATQNVGIQNQGQQYNLDQNQNIANANVNLGNQQQVANNMYQQQAFQDQLAKGGAASKPSTDLRQSAQDTQNWWASLGQGLGKVGTAAAPMLSGGSKDSSSQQAAPDYSTSQYQTQVGPWANGYGEGNMNQGAYGNDKSQQQWQGYLTGTQSQKKNPEDQNQYYKL